ncbi:MAG: hypothetical protein OXF01_10675 [Gemmatimonadetes bacterium]|nr:hypothetical protein [Gemmatimonadota bacterium]
MGLCLLGLIALYAVYAVGAFVALGSATPFVERVVKLFGMAFFPLPLLAAPATYFAALGRFDLYGEMGSAMRRRHCKQLGLIALGTFSVLVVAPLAYDYAVSAFIGPYQAVLPEGMAANNARLMVPLAVALFVIVAGVGGAATGRITRGLTTGSRYVARWTVGAALVGSFLATMVIMAELIAMRGVLSPPWLALAPPAVPFALMCVLARRDCVRVIRSLAERLGVHRRDHPNPAETDALVTGLRQVVAPAVAIDEPRVREIVAGLAATAGATAGSQPTRSWRKAADWRWSEMAGGFAGSWAYLSVGFLWLGGAGLSPPTVVSALSAGLIGATGAVLTSR